MTTGNDVVFTPGRAPEDAGWPGPSYSREVDGNMVVERNVVVPMHDGLKLRVDLYRPAETALDLPVIVAWSPYGKHGALSFSSWPGHDVDLQALSKYTAFETPDPAFWVRHGYAVILADARGTWGSEGNVSILGPEEIDACCDLVEWAGTRPWSNGKVGMAGVSYYAAIQWGVAARRPPHLAAINPWEGFSDQYREVGTHGGIPETQLSAALAPLVANSHGLVENMMANALDHPFYDSYWRAKAPDLTAVEVPAYVVASWSDHGLHTRGTLEGFRQVSSAQKWLEVHGRKKWAYYYDHASLERQVTFFDHVLKGADNAIADWPSVRLEVRDRAYTGAWRDESEWPLARTEYTPLYLDGADHSLNMRPPERPGMVHYDARSGHVEFDHTFTTDTEITGYAKLRLWVEARDGHDMDLFVAVQKLDTEGQLVPFPFFSTFDDGNAALGWLRVSRRELETGSTPEQPRYAHQSDKPIGPGQVVPIDIEIWPSSTLFHAGESLRLRVQGHDINRYPDGLFAQSHDFTVNAGTHVIHTGGSYDSHLLLPVIPSQPG